MTDPHLRQPSRWARFPFDPARWPFFYGWTIVAVTAIGIIASIPGQTVGVGVFTDSLIAALGLTRDQLSRAYMFGTLTSSLVLPFAGKLVDRYGTRVMVVASSLGLGLSLVVMSRADWIPAMTTSPFWAIVLTAVGFLLIRFFGQGCLTMVSRVTLSKWFNRRRGLASGISNVFTGFAFNSSPAILNAILEQAGWQRTYLYLALAVGVGMALLGGLFYRDNPEQCGLVMDGVAGEAADPSGPVPRTIRQYTRGEALRTLPFWIYSAVFGWQALFMTAVPFHITAIGAECGLDRAAALGLFTYVGVCGVLVAVVIGATSDRIRLKYLLLATIVCQALAALGLMHLNRGAGQILFFASYGISGGLFGLLLTIVWPRYYGRDHLGAISGVTMSVLVCSSAVGPWLFNGLYDWIGSFRAVMFAAALVPLALLVPALLVRNPQAES